MRRKTLCKAKLVVTVESNKRTSEICPIRTVSVYDNRTQTYWTKEQIKERGIVFFLNMADLKETLNWNLNGDSSKYQFGWKQSSKEKSTGVAYIFD